jgi:hypothetical protein
MRFIGLFFERFAYKHVDEYGERSRDDHDLDVDLLDQRRCTE